MRVNAIVSSLANRSLLVQPDYISKYTRRFIFRVFGIESCQTRNTVATKEA